MKKKFFALVLLFVSSILLGQEKVSEINAILQIPDSLTNESEIRIYKRYEITNGTDVLRLFRKNKKWEAELYHYYHPLNKNDKPKFEKEKLTASSNNELVWLKILISNVEFLPKWESFDYKLETQKIVIEGGEYLFSVTKSAISDGETYNVFFRSYSKTNDFTYSNPESYLITYPGIDELEMFSKVLIIIREEFGIWKK